MKVETKYRPIIKPPKGYTSTPLLRITKGNKITEINLLSKKTHWDRFWWAYALAAFLLLTAYKIYIGDFQF